MKLAEGMRVGLGVEELTCIAVVRHVNDEAIDLDLLDQVKYEERDGEVIIFVPDAEGLHYWRAVAPRPPAAGRLSVTLVGPSEMMQRRQYQRYDVDFPAQIRRISGGRRGRASDVRIIDLSYGGAKIIGPTPIETGDTVIVDFDLGHGPLVATARVAMAYPDGEGQRISHLAFTPPELSAAALLGIETYLGTLSPSELAG
jgi:hypothetical protein